MDTTPTQKVESPILEGGNAVKKVLSSLRNANFIKWKGRKVGFANKKRRRRLNALKSGIVISGLGLTALGLTKAIGTRRAMRRAEDYLAYKRKESDQELSQSFNRRLGEIRGKNPNFSRNRNTSRFF